MATVCHLSFPTFATLILLVQARLNLEPTDHEALLAIHKDLGVRVSTGSTSICNAAGIFCERRISNTTAVLRITRIYHPHSGRSEISGNSFLEGPLPAMNQLESKSMENNKFVPKRYSFAESDSPPNSSSNQTGNSLAPAPSPTSAPAHKNKNKKKKVISWILGFSAGTVAGIICGAIFLVLFKMVLNMIKGKKNDPGPAIFSQLIKAEELAFLDKDDGVASLQIIGKGGCGEVYKMDLPSSKVKTVAIKKIIQPPKDAAELTEEDTKLLNKKMRQIKSEIQTVGQIRHRNLVLLLAHVSRPNCHYLVYEFMKNRSLQDILQQVKDGSRELDWLARHRIALGVAAGLEYLHLSHTPRIVHRDLKPANVLLDDDMEARIADFGLAKSIPDADTHMTSSNVAGTLGYIAPEYHQTLKFTDKCDIYSFGVVLVVLVMGKLPSDGFFQSTSEMSLVKWLRNVMTSEDSKQAIEFDGKRVRGTNASCS
ncbi:hypothetical protein L1987_44945 [Smallanthus sonchifolius]|uniref:Uncharacterized protein n=1 Tax=Smallanthus sonchifolius TaxID=185202 RepID=A0ACB9GQN8_9ASTR|nr:hypothetical protein L1987_44945 [Smallanthus sonchifolius]